MDKSIIAHYAELGYPVLPLIPGDKKPLSRLVPNGLKNATRDLDTISYWLKDAPDANVGILPREDVLVLDFDRPEAWQALLGRYPVLGSYPRQRTPSGGVHVFMRIPKEAVGKITTSVRLMDGVDIRGLGKAYVATAPSRVNGAEYVWEVPLVPPDELPEIPAGLLLELIEAARAKESFTPPPPPPTPGTQSDQTRKRVEGLIRWACERVAAAKEGTRHNTLRDYAHLLGGWIHYAPDLFDVAHQALYEAALRTGLDRSDAWGTARDGLVHGMKNPLPLPESTQAAFAYLDWVRGEAGVKDSAEERPAHPLEGLSGGLLLADGKPQYVVRNGVIHYGAARTKNGETEVIYTPLCAFSAVIRRVIEDSDGAETTLIYEIEGYLEDGTPLPPVQVTAKEFASLEWVRKAWGPNAAISGTPSAERHIRAAIEFLSRRRYETVRIYRHTGWTQINGRWHYLHAGGAIGGLTEGEVRVELPSRLAGFALPDPPQHPVEAAEAHMELLGLTEAVQPHVALPLVVYTISAPLGRAPYPVYLAGPTMAGKTTLAMLAQSAFAPGLELPAQNWSSTANALEGTAFALKDSLLLVDDFAPSANRWSREDLQAKAEQLIRAQVSGTGRARLRADGRLKGDRPPRGNLLITGEDLPHTHSIRNRTLFLEVRRGDVDFAKISHAQNLARKGVFAKAMAHWIRWLAPRLDEVRARLEERIEELRPRWKGVHNRTATALAHLQAVWEIYNEYLLDLGLELGEPIHEMFMEALRTVAAWQEDADQDADPVERFPELLRALFDSGRAHLIPTTPRKAPEEWMDDPAAWGWKFRITGRYEDENTGELKTTGVWDPQGKMIGWVPEWPEHEGIYLIPDVAWAELNRLASETGAGLPSQKALWTQLAHAGLIEAKEEGGRRRYTVVKRIGGRLVRVVHVLPRALESGEEDNSDPPPSLDGGPDGKFGAKKALEEPAHVSATPLETEPVGEEGYVEDAEPPLPQSGDEEREVGGDARPLPTQEPPAGSEEDAPPDSSALQAPSDHPKEAVRLEVPHFDTRDPEMDDALRKVASWHEAEPTQPPQPKKEPPKKIGGCWGRLVDQVNALVLKARQANPVAIEARVDGAELSVLKDLEKPLGKKLVQFFERCSKMIAHPQTVELYALYEDKPPALLARVRAKAPRA